MTLVFLSILILGYFAEKFAHYIPYSYEVSATSNFDLPFSNNEETPDPQSVEIETYLQDLADRIVKTQNLPDEMKITVHYMNNDTVNAFATLGGHIVFFRGLLEQLTSENALAMVMSHEIAHIKHRHPIASMGRAVVIGLTISVIAGSTDNNTLGNLLGDAGLLTSLTFSRDMEREADKTALQSIVSLYGHTAGTKNLFQVLQSSEAKGNIRTPEFLSSHPVTQNRIENIDKMATELNWKTTGEITALPEEFRTLFTTGNTGEKTNVLKSNISADECEN